MNAYLKDTAQAKRSMAPIKITGIYFLVGALWILASEKLFNIFVHHEYARFYMQNMRGWFFLIATAGMLYVLIRKGFVAIEKGRYALQKSMAELRERNKELNCLYSVSELLEKRHYTLQEMLQGITDLLPPACRYPEIACARLVLNSKEFKTMNFVETKWKLACDLLVKEEPVGTLEVYYLEKRSESDEGPFLKEEKSLVSAIAGRLGKTIERREAEIALQESEKRFRDLVENSLTGISIVQNTQVIFQNQEQERLLGVLPRSNILGDFKNIHPDDVGKVKNLSQEINSGRIKRLDIDFRLYPGNKDEEEINMKWVYCRAMLIDYGSKEAILVNMIDMTKTRALEQMLIIQDKMASLGRVAAGIAHEIRNPLSGVNIYLNTLEKIYDKAENHAKVERIFGQIKSASNKIESVIRRVMDFSKPSEPKISEIDINFPIKEAIHLTAITMRKSEIKIEQALAENLPSCYADPNLIEEMVLNLVNNAADAMRNFKGKKEIIITSALINDNIVVKVSDSGPGVPEGIRAKIFDPFYTTKHDSTGIGLSLCHRIANDHGGTLSMKTSELGGAEFRIEIPIREGVK